jgi:hypothetical protein
LDGCESDANPEPEHDSVIERLVHELVVSGDTGRSWAEEMDIEMGLEPQSEYMTATYSPIPAPPSPAPWHPQPPTSDYVPPQTHYQPLRTWYYPIHVQRTPRRPHSRPHTRPPPARRRPFENRTSHVTATRRDGLRTTRTVLSGQPRYVPPALRSNIKTSYRSQQPWSNHSNNWRDPPPHKDLSARNPNRSDSPNWRAPSPNRPATFRNPSPLPQSPPTPPISPPCPTPLMPPKNHTESRLTFELISLMKTTSEALQNIVRITERLIRQVNTERRLAHKLQRTPWSSHEDVHCVLSPLHFLLGGGYLWQGHPRVRMY